MARIEDLIDQIADPAVRDEIARQVKLLKSTKRFGLVFEDHVPETISLFGLPIRSGSIVQNRRTPEDQTRFQVVAVNGETASLVPVGLDEPRVEVEIGDLLVVKAFEEPIFPGLTQVGEIRRGPSDKPAHTVISGENFHALQLLAYTHASQVDVIYIDPPYNTGDKSWKYNNRFVDSNDSWRHSKWLAMMEKRLRLSRELLKPDGVLIVTIDEHEVHHLAMLLEDLFPDATRQMVTIVINPAGVDQGGYARVEEFAIVSLFGASDVVASFDDFLTGDSSTKGRSTVRWDSLLRSGTNALPSDRPNLVYPIGIDPATGRIVGTGTTLKSRADAGLVEPDAYDSWVPSRTETVEGHPVAWPIRSDGTLGNWQVSRPMLAELQDSGYVAVGGYDEGRETWPLRYLSAKVRRQIVSGDVLVSGRDETTGVVQVEYKQARRTKARTVWNRSAHNAGVHGSKLLRDFLGSRRFDFPKSPYVVVDTLNSVIALRPNAVVLDYFAGSGTTLHAVALLNAQDGGNRQCILVTNNDVSDADSKRLNKAGGFAGDREYESHGIFESVAKPRVEAAITGVRLDGKPVVGKYLDQYLPDHSYAEGFEENVNFFRMDYLEPDLVELGRQFNAIAPLLWMAAGSVGDWEEWDAKAPWSAPDDSTHAVLFDPSVATAFGSYVEARPEITHVWIVTDSHSAYVETRAELPTDIEVGQLYRDYLRNFMINIPGALG